MATLDAIEPTSTGFHEYLALFYDAEIRHVGDVDWHHAALLTPLLEDVGSANGLSVGYRCLKRLMNDVLAKGNYVHVSSVDDV